jgi:pyruvate/2-oxoglutarate dehydrogenase complex dihydrolipoamide dehydrogenase (E3) component
VVPQSESVLKVDLVIEALGQTISDEVRHALADLVFTREGFIQVEPGSFRTSQEHVYAAGDMINGGTTAVQCISEGMRAAAQISAGLKAFAAKV